MSFRKLLMINSLIVKSTNLPIGYRGVRNENPSRGLLSNSQKINMYSPISRKCICIINFTYSFLIILKDIHFVKHICDRPGI